MGPEDILTGHENFLGFIGGPTKYSYTIKGGGGGSWKFNKGYTKEVKFQNLVQGNIYTSILRGIYYVYKY